MLKLKRQILIVLILIALVAVPSIQPSFATGMVPQTALDFRMRTADGGEISSDMLRGDVVVLAFGASWLPLSKVQMQAIQELSNNYADRNLRVYWVSTDSNKPQSRNFASDDQLRDLARKNGLKVAVLRDPDGAFLKKIGADQIPVTVIVDRDGRLSGAPIGGISTDPKHKLVDIVAARLNKILG